MFKKSFVPVLAIAVAAVGCDADALTSSADGPETDIRASAHGGTVASAEGGGNWTLEVFGLEVEQVLTLNARKSSDGRVRGHVDYHQTVDDAKFHLAASITCMSVYDAGTRVKFGGPVALSNAPSVPANGEVYMWFQVIDNGRGAASAPDQSTGVGLGSEAENQAFCDSPAEPNPMFLADVTSGNFTVDG